jgi:ADP-heptose:LPS heptosyltransferase
LIFDPDTRLTQLGLVPLLGGGNANLHSNYLFFPSREFGGSGSQSLGELTSLWLDHLFDQNVRTYSFVSLRPADTEAARNLTSRFSRDNSQPIVTMNFGVGENSAKCLGDEFEQALVISMIQHGAIVILDKSASSEEIARADRIVSAAARIERDGTSMKVVELDEQRLESLPKNIDVDLVTWNGRIGLLAALIAQSDLYIGYDSAGQHIAAALGVPCIDVFAGFNSERFVHRWSPTGTAETRVVTVGAGGGSGELAERVTQHAIEMLRRRKPGS